MSSAVFDQLRSDIDEVERFATTFALSMAKKPSDGGWTGSQCLAHIADAEISLALRLRMILTSDDYKFISWDEDAFAVIKHDRDARISVETFIALRRGNLELLESLRPEQLLRYGIKANGEPISLIDYAAYMSGHVRTHLEQAATAAQG